MSGRLSRNAVTSKKEQHPKIHSKNNESFFVPQNVSIILDKVEDKCSKCGFVKRLDNTLGPSTKLEFTTVPNFYMLNITDAIHNGKFGLWAGVPISALCFWNKAWLRTITFPFSFINFTCYYIDRLGEFFPLMTLSLFATQFQPNLICFFLS